MTPDLYLLPIDPRRTNPFNRAEEGHRLIAAETQTSTSYKHDIISFQNSLLILFYRIEDIDIT